MSDQEKMLEEIAKRDTIIERQAEALKEIARLYEEYSGGEYSVEGYSDRTISSYDQCCVAKQALSASAESVAAWKAEKLEPLRREVAMLHNVTREIVARVVRLNHLEPDKRIAYNELVAVGNQLLKDTQATAKAYERELKSKVLNAYERDGDTYTRQCVRCLIRYKPIDSNEDCPYCGCTDSEAKELRAQSAQQKEQGR